MFAALKERGIVTTRAGAYKPRTSPYDFQGHGADCLPYVFELAGKYGIRVIAMEITHESHIDEIRKALAASGNATGVMLQIGTRNAQNFELLKAVGQQTELPVLFKRGMGITLEESLNACEYVATGGNRRIFFCLRGMKTNLGDPHRNLVDFAHVPVVQAPDAAAGVHRSLALGRQPGARRPTACSTSSTSPPRASSPAPTWCWSTSIPSPGEALCDGPQALLLSELPRLIEDTRIVREAYEARVRRV